MENSAEKLAQALDRMRDRSLSEAEHEVAVQEFLEANAQMLDRMGVERRSAVRVGQAVAAALLIAVVVSMALNINYSVTANQTADKAQATATVARETARELRSLQTATVLNQRRGCVRSNEKQASQVKNLEGDEAKVRAEEAFITALLPDPSPTRERYLSVIRGYAKLKQDTIQEQIDAVAEVAKKKGSPEADCKRAYPLDKPAARVLRHGGGDSAARGVFPRSGLELALAGE